MDRIININEKKTLLEKNEFSDEPALLEPGNHSFAFDFQLPSDIPTSFEQPKGSIRYWIGTCIDMPWSLKHYLYRGFTIIKPLDLNSLPNLHLPTGVTETEVLLCGPCQSKPISITFEVTKSNQKKIYFLFLSL